MGAGRRAFLCCPALGFTLIEIVFVLGIMAVLAAIALPNWGTLLPDYNLRGGARQVQSELHNIKSRAASQNKTFRLNFSATGDNYTIQDASTSPPTALATKSLPEGINVFNDIILGFTPRGTASPSGGTLALCNSKNSGKNVVVSPTGRIRIENATC